MSNSVLNLFINKMLQSRPDVKNDPQKMEALNTILNGDAQKGQEIAKSICQNKNANPQDATNMASQWLASVTGGESTT